MVRALVHYFLIGGLLFGGKALWDSRHANGPEITVRVSSTATAAEVERATREAILLNEARRYGWDRNDPVVFGHLVRNMRFIEPESTEDDVALYERAIEINMQRHDPVVRARLLYRAREALSYVPDDRMPSRDALERHRLAHPERFERPGRARFQHVFLSRTKRGDGLPADAKRMRETLSGLGDEPPRNLGDPLPGLLAEQVASVRKVQDLYGAQVAAVLDDPATGAWRGPASSVYGLHFIKVLEREPVYLPSLDAIRAEVRADLLREIRAELRQQRMAALDEAYTVNVEKAP